MRRSKSMSPKVEGLESLVYLSAVVPVATAEVDGGEPLPSPNGPADVHESAENGLTPAPVRPAPVVVVDGPSVSPIDDGMMHTTEVVPISAPAGRAIGGPVARPIAMPGGREFAGPAARPVGGPAIDLANLDLSSTARGNYRLHLAPDGSSGSFQLQGIAQIRGLGPARVTTDYAADANSAPETMTMTISTRRGDLTLQVGRQPGIADPDESTARLGYQIVGSTGSLAGANGSGIVDMTLRPQMRTLGASGQMSLAFRPAGA